MQIGVAYYPEHWPEKDWSDDFALMAEAGIERVRMGEFAWSRMEPEEGTYEFDWLERAIDLAAEHGIETVLCTPTEAPPPWLTDRYPDTLPVDMDGIEHTGGSRRHVDPTSEVFCQRADEIVRRMGDRFGDNPNVAGWQLDNEIGAHTYLKSASENAEEAFQAWLAEKYESPQVMSDAWGGAFWSGEYTDFEAVKIYTNPPSGLNPGYELDFHRFSQEVWIDFLRRQAEELAPRVEDQWLTHNVTWYGEQHDLYEPMEFLDVLGIDVYQSTPGLVSMIGDLFYSASDGRYAVMEMHSSPPVLEHDGEIGVAEGQLTHWLVKHALHGAELSSMFRFQPAPGGCEMTATWDLRDLSARPTESVGEVQRAREVVDQIEPTLSGGRSFDVAFVFDPDNFFFAYTQAGSLYDDPEGGNIAYIKQFQKWHEAISACGHNVRFVRSIDDLSDYDLVVANGQFILTDEARENFRGYVENGGTLVGLGKMGYVTEGGRRTRAVMPQGLTDVFGASVDRPLSGPYPEVRVGDEDVTIDQPACTLDAEDADVLGTYTNWTGENDAAVTHGTYGDGDAVYVGPIVSRAFADALVPELLDVAGLDDRTAGFDLPEGVELYREFGLVALFNHTGDDLAVGIDDEHEDALSGDTVSESVAVPAYGFRLLSD